MMHFKIESSSIDEGFIILSVHGVAGIEENRHFKINPVFLVQLLGNETIPIGAEKLHNLFFALKGHQRCHKKDEPLLMSKIKAGMAGYM
jgi:hypothetical protein